MVYVPVHVCMQHYYSCVQEFSVSIQGWGTVSLGTARFFEGMFGNSSPVALNHSLEDINLHQHHCEELKTSQERCSFKYIDC
jgi:hypothetical protein